MARTKTTTATKPTRTTNKAKGRKDKAPADKAPAEAPRDNRYLRASRIIVKNLDINAEALAIAASMSESTAGHCLAAWEGVTHALREAKLLPDKAAATGKAPEPAPVAADKAAELAAA